MCWEVEVTAHLVGECGLHGVGDVRAVLLSAAVCFWCWRQR